MLNHDAQMLPVQPERGTLAPLTLTEVQLAQTGFWGARQQVNRQVTIPHCVEWQEKAEWLANFDKAAQGAVPDRQGREFSDSEAYKVMEAIAWQYGWEKAAELDELFERLAQRIAAAQAEDGYLNTNFGLPGRPARYSDMEWGHELYNYGHLLQAAVARGRTKGADAFVAVARRVADHICDTFGPDGRETVCGHPEVELGLAEFGRYLGEPRYIEQAKLFIERRGKGLLKDIEYGPSYFQDEVPFREAEVFHGHAVRALYLAAAAVDVAIATDDADLLEKVESQFARTLSARTYVTGGMGSRHQDEAFGDDFMLPNDRAYAESCAGIAAVMLSWRLLLATGNVKYADFIERVLYNVVATAVAESGDAFFYANVLHRREAGAVPDPNRQSKRVDSSMRAPWFDVSCCPNNLARTFASLAGYLVTKTEAPGVQIHQFANAHIQTELTVGVVGLEISTNYPDDAVIKLKVVESPALPWEISVRVPEWVKGATLRINGGIAEEVAPGYAGRTATWQVGDELTLELPQQTEWLRGDPRIDGVAGQVALQVGPRVYCLESADLPEGVHVDQVILHTDSSELVDGVVWCDATIEESELPQWPYQSAPFTPDREQRVRVPLRPYHGWAQRVPSSMRVWLRH